MTSCYPPLPVWEQVRKPKPLPDWYVRFGTDVQIEEDENGMVPCAQKRSQNGRPPTSRDAILAFLTEKRTWGTCAEMAANLGMKITHVNRVLRYCVAHNLLERRKRPDKRTYTEYEYRVPAKVQTQPHAKGL